MKTLTLTLSLAALAFSSQAHALTTCAGVAGNVLVTVKVATSGNTGAASGAVVTLGNTSYQIKKEEISQYFESSTPDGKKAVAGLQAFVGGENPVAIRYSGINYQDDLQSVLRNPNRVKESGNEMRVWKGPGFPADQQVQILDLVCQVFQQLP